LIGTDSRFHSTKATLEFLEKHNIKTIKRYGSAIKLCKLAEGEIDVYPRLNGTKKKMDVKNGYLSSFKNSREKKSIIKPILGIILVLLVIAVFYLRKKDYIPSSEIIFNFLKSHSILAPLLFILLYSIMPSLFMPTLPLNIGAGFLWGPFWGSIYSIIGSTIGSAPGFLISRYIAGDYFKYRFNFKAWNYILDKVDKNSWKVVAFTRITPIFPSTVLSYLFGITAIPFLEYLWATFIFMLPICIAFSVLGSSIREFVLIGNLKGIIAGIIIAIVALFILFGLKPIIKNLLPKNEVLTESRK